MLKITEQYKTHYDIARKIWSGPAIKPYYDRNCSFGYIAFEELRRRPSHICQISDSENTRLTNEEVRLQAIRIARRFAKLGIKQSDIIGISARNTTYLFGVVLACFFHGCAYHAISPLHDKSTSKHLFEITKPKIIFCDGSELEKIRYAASEWKTEIYTLKTHSQDVPSVLNLLKPTGDEYLYQPAELENGTTQNLAILCSSGTTGKPKAVTISHLNRIWTTSNYLTAEDIQFMLSTLDWLSSLIIMVNSICYGATRVITEKPFSPEYFLEVVQKYKITYSFNSASTVTMLVKCTETTPEKLASLRYLICSGSKATLAAIRAMQGLLPNACLINVYGLTELNNGLTGNMNTLEKPESAGLLLPGMKVRIINENGANLGPHEIGEILCTNGEHWAGYYNNAEATHTIYDREGWLHTGDMGYFDKDHYLYMTERKKDLLKYEGMQYSPSQIEEIISLIPDVKEVCVFGIQNELHGDIAAAAVVRIEGSSLTADDVIQYVRKNIGAEYMQLHGGCKLFEEIPKLPNAKVDRKAAKVIFLEK